MAFKSMGPGDKTGAEGDAAKSPGNKSFYPDRESPGKSVGGDDAAPKAEGSNVPARPNPQSGNLSEVKSEMNKAVKESADYGGHGDGKNPTGSDTKNPAGERTGHEDGQYGDRGFDDKGGS